MPTLICDLGGVLFAEVDPQRRIDVWRSVNGGVLGVAAGEELRDDVLRGFESGRVAEAEYAQHLRGLLEWVGTDEQLIGGWRQPPRAVNLDVVEVLGRLRERGWDLVGAADVTPWDEQALREEFGWVLELFDRVVSSTAVHARRPDPRFFAELRGAARSGPRLYVDDDPHNVSAARRAGLDAHLFTTAAALEAACRRLVVTVG
jgi:FMN phosphatase YigB (HAD superfamily)